MKKMILLVAAIALAAGAHAQTKVEWGVKAGADLSKYSISAEGLSATVNPGSKVGFYVGGVNNLWFNDKFGIQTELTYNYNGARLHLSDDIATLVGNIQKDPDVDNIVKYKSMGAGIAFHTLRLPIMAKFRPAAGLSIMAGPYVSLRLGAKVRFNDNFEDAYKAGNEDGMPISKITDKLGDLLGDNLRNFDFGAAMGVEYSFKSGLFIDLHYNISLLNSLKKDIDVTSIAEDEDNINLKDQFGVQPTIRYSAVQLGVGFRF